MFDRLEDLVKRLEEVMEELSEPDVVNDQTRFRNLMKEQNELTPSWRSIMNIRTQNRPSRTAWRCWSPRVMKRCGRC